MLVARLKTHLYIHVYLHYFCIFYSIIKNYVGRIALCQYCGAYHEESTSYDSQRKQSSNLNDDGPEVRLMFLS